MPLERQRENFAHPLQQWICGLAGAVPHRAVPHRDTLPYGSIQRLLVELHTCCLGRSREYAAVRLFTQVPSRETAPPVPQSLCAAPPRPGELIPEVR